MTVHSAHVPFEKNLNLKNQNDETSIPLNMILKPLWTISPFSQVGQNKNSLNEKQMNNSVIK